MFFCLCKGSGNTVRTFTSMEKDQFKVSKLKQVNLCAFSPAWALLSVCNSAVLAYAVAPEMDALRTKTRESIHSPEN
jgi:hypothetical protein